MAISIDHKHSPIRLNDQVKLFDEVLTGSGTIEKFLRVESASIYTGLFVSAISGTLDIKVESVGNENEYTEPLIDYPSITSTTSTIVEKQAARTFELIKVTVTYTDACEFNFHIRGIEAGAASVQLVGSSNFEVEQITIPTTTTQLVAAALTSREGILIGNENSSGNLLIAETSAKVTTGTKVWIIKPGGNMSIDLGPGQSIYAKGATTSVDVRYVQIGGG